MALNPQKAEAVPGESSTEDRGGSNTPTHCLEKEIDPMPSMTAPREPRPVDTYGRHWRDSAACLDKDPELFFPIGDGTAKVPSAQVVEAKKVCQGCPVRATCLAWALDTGQDAGVWGGLSEGERRAMKRRARRPGAGEAAA